MAETLASYTTDPMALTAFALVIMLMIWFAYSLRRRPE